MIVQDQRELAMIIKRSIAVESLTKVCEESLNLIKQLIDADNDVYAKGYEDGMAAQSKVQRTLRPWFGLTAEEREQVQAESYGKVPHHVALIAAVEAKLKEKNNG
jgi:hypothetical protein